MNGTNKEGKHIEAVALSSNAKVVLTIPASVATYNLNIYEYDGHLYFTNKEISENCFDNGKRLSTDSFYCTLRTMPNDYHHYIKQGGQAFVSCDLFFRTLENPKALLYFNKDRKEFVSNIKMVIENYNKAKQRNFTITNINDITLEMIDKYKNVFSPAVITSIINEVIDKIKIEVEAPNDNSQDVLILNNTLKQIYNLVAPYGGPKDTNNKIETESVSTKELIVESKPEPVVQQLVNLDDYIKPEYYNTLKKFITNAQEGCFDVTSLVHREINNSTYISCCYNMYISYKNDMGAGGITSFMEHKKMWNLTLFYLEGIMNPRAFCRSKYYHGDVQFMKFVHGGEPRYRSMIVGIWNNTVVDGILPKITQENYNEVLNSIKSMAEYERELKE